jgi:solute carrier family 25 protein 39/40
VTPFDVLKTRLQTVQPQSSQSQSVNLTANSLRPASECCQTSLLTQPPPPASSRRLGKAKQSPAPNPLTCFTSTAPDDISRSQSARASNARALYSSLTGTVVSPGEAPSGCAFPSKWAGIWGEAVNLEEALARNVRSTNGGMALAGGEGMATLVLPLQASPTGRGGFWGEVAAVRSEVGVRGLWKGVGTALQVLECI